MPQNLIEKIAQNFSFEQEANNHVHSGDFISLQPAHVMTHDNTGAVIPKFLSIGAKCFANPRQVVNTLDHNIQDTSPKNLEKYEKIKSFAEKMGSDFYPAGRGIGHQIMIEEGYAWPGTVVVASDSHSNMYGGLGALGTPIVRTDAAAIWATGRTWWQIPPVAKVVLNGKLLKGVTGKDVIIALCGYFNNDEVLNHIIEFSGIGISGLTIDQRLSISNMTTEWGALGGVFPIDEITIGWLRQRADFIIERGLEGVPSDADGKGIHPRINHSRINELEKQIKYLLPDENAFYSKELVIDLSSIQPYVSGPNSVKTMTSISDMKAKKLKVNKAYLVSCVNSRLEDIAEAAEVMKSHKVSDDVEFYISAASSEVQAKSEYYGYWKTLINAGAKPLPPGCGPCIGLGTGLLEEGEVGISATNRNFKGRMGSPNAEAYLASPSVVAASAISGYIDLPWEFEPLKINGSIKANKKSQINKSKIDIIEGFPTELEGNILFCNEDNLNTDGMYPGKYTYLDDFKPEDQARVAMENYDPNFQNIAIDGDILVGGFNFGTGSSREQAATALKYRGISLVIAGSFSSTYQRNALNNGFLVVEQSEFVDDLKNYFGSESPTIRSEFKIKISFTESLIKWGNKTFSINPVGKAAQELIVLGGLENWVKSNL